MNPKNASFILAASLSIATFGLAQEGTSTAKVGDPAPDFELVDANGKTHQLSDFKGKKNLVLEFFRSGDW